MSNTNQKPYGGIIDSEAMHNLSYLNTRFPRIPSPVDGLRWIDTRRTFYRWSLKILFLLTLVLLVLFPRVDLVPKTVQRYMDPNDLVNPNSSALDPVIDEFENERQPEWTRNELMNHIEGFVYRKIVYARDWNVWINAEYLPTVEEVIEKGKGDCGARAVLAASMLRAYDFDAILVGNFEHIWVKTDIGETMSPGDKTLVEYTDEGRRFDWSTLWDIPNEFCYSVSVFPLWRELIIVLGAWLLLIGRGVRFRYNFLWLLLLLLGLLLVRDGGNGGNPETVKNWAGLLTFSFAVVALVIQSNRAAKRLIRKVK